MKLGYKFLLKVVLVWIVGIGIFSSDVLAQGLSNDTEMKEYFESKMQEKDYDIAKAVILEIVKDDTAEVRPDIAMEADIRYQHLVLQILTGKHKGETLTVRHAIEMIMPGNYIFKQNDKVLIRITEDTEGQFETIRIEERVREFPNYIIIILFVAIMTILGRGQGLKALLSLIVTIGLIFFVYIPLILRGYWAIGLSIVISAVAIAITLFIISGKHKKTGVAILGTISGVVVAGILAIVFGSMGKLTGLAGESAISLAYIPQFRWLNYQGILFGTIIIGSIGAIMDVALSIASSMWEIWELNPNIDAKTLMKSGMNIGRDIMGSMSNTLILAYVGTSLHLIILFMVYNISLSEIMNYDSVSSEILRAMAGSIGLMFTIPATVWFAAMVYLRQRKKKKVN